MENKELIIEFLKYSIEFFEKLITQTKKPDGSYLFRQIGFCQVVREMYHNRFLNPSEYNDIYMFITRELYPKRTRKSVDIDVYYFNRASERIEVAKKLLKEYENK